MKYPKARQARHPIETGALTIMSELRRLPVGEISIENNSWIVPEFYFSWDDDHSIVHFTARHLEERVFRIEAEITGVPRWISMNFGVGRGKLVAGDVLGVALGAKSETELPLEGFFRSAGAEEGPQDTPLMESITLSPHRSTGLALQTLTEWDPLTHQENNFHTLVLTLPPRNFYFDLWDLRVFVLSKGFGLNSGLPTLTNTWA